MLTQLGDAVITMDDVKYKVDTSKLSKRDINRISDFTNGKKCDQSTLGAISKLCISGKIDLVKVEPSDIKPSSVNISAQPAADLSTTKFTLMNPNSTPTPTSAAPTALTAPTTTTVPTVTKSNIIATSASTIDHSYTCDELVRDKVTNSEYDDYHQLLYNIHSNVIDSIFSADPKYANARFELSISGAELSPDLAELHKTTLIWNIVKNVPELVVIASNQFRPSSYVNINNMLKLVLSRATALYDLTIAIKSVGQLNTVEMMSRAIESGDINAEFLIKLYMLDSSLSKVSDLYDEYAGEINSIIISECAFLLIGVTSAIIEDMLRYSEHYLKQLKNIEYLLDDSLEERDIKSTIYKIYYLKRELYKKIIVVDFLSFQYIDQYYNPIHMYEIDFVNYITIRLNAVITSILVMPYPTTGNASIKKFISNLYGMKDHYTGERINPFDSIIRCIDNYREYYSDPNTVPREELSGGTSMLLCLFEPHKQDRELVKYSDMLEHVARYTDVLFTDSVRPRNFERYKRDEYEVNIIYQITKIYKQYCYTQSSLDKINHLINTRLLNITAIQSLGQSYLNKFALNQPAGILGKNYTSFVVEKILPQNVEILAYIVGRMKVHHFMRFINRNTKLEAIENLNTTTTLMIHKGCMIFEFEPIFRLMIPSLPLLEEHFYYILENSTTLVIADTYVEIINKYGTEDPYVMQYELSDLIGETYMKLDNGIVVPRLLLRARLANKALYLIYIYLLSKQTNNMSQRKLANFMLVYTNIIIAKLDRLVKLNRVQALNHIHIYSPGTYKDIKQFINEYDLINQYTELTTKIILRFMRMSKNYEYIDILAKYPDICNLRDKMDTFMIPPELYAIFDKYGFKRIGVLPYYECEYCNMLEYCPSAIWVCKTCNKCVSHIYCICTNNEGTEPIECNNCLF
jgi:hypothetical protein